MMTESVPAQEAIEALTGFLNTKSLLDLACRFSNTYSGLAKTSTEHFLTTPVTALPTGEEQGKFLCIDVGGSNLRAGFVELLGDNDNVTRSIGDDVFAKIKRSCDKSWPIGDHLKMDQAEDLFLWIGDCIAEVITDSLNDTSTKNSESSSDEDILLGITFSFPMSQTCLSEATLLPMGKGFAITSQLNLGEMILAGYARHCTPSADSTASKRLPKIRVAAITNDTVATFASLAYAVQSTPNSRVAMGLIVGTGTNATIPMSPASLHPSKLATLPNPSATQTVVINTEWTIRGTDAPLVSRALKTPWDITLDAHSEAPGFQPFEYMTSGRYLGELVRLVFTDVVASEGTTDIPSSLQRRNAMSTHFLAETVAGPSDDAVVHRLETAFPSNQHALNFWSPQRTDLLRSIARAVQMRSAALVAAACVGLLGCVGEIHIDLTPSASEKAGDADGMQNGHAMPRANIHAPQELVIAYAGGTISHYPEWLETCQRWIDEVVAAGSARNTARVVLREALDGGIVGAGVLAGMGGRIE